MLMEPASSLVGIFTLGIRDARLHPAPMWDSPGFWLWVASPCLAWAMANYFARARFYPSLVMALGAVIGNVGGLVLVGHDAMGAETPGGMNPFLSNNIAFTLVLVAFVQWILLALALGLAVALWKRTRAS